MKTAPISAAKNRSGWKTWAAPASEVPTSTGATEAGSVRTRAAMSQMRTPLALPARGAGRARVVLAAEEPDLLRALGPDHVREQARAEAAVEGPDARAGLAEARVLGGDREVADEVQDLAAAHRVAGDHRDHRLGQPPDLHV